MVHGNIYVQAWGKVAHTHTCVPHIYNVVAFRILLVMGRVGCVGRPALEVLMVIVGVGGMERYWWW